MKPVLFGSARHVLIGVVHLQPLPGSPRWREPWSEVLKKAVADAKACQQGGANAIFIENFGDVPFGKSSVGPETVAAMAAAGAAVREAVQISIGFNVLRNDAHAALALCAVCGGDFVRVNIHTGAMLTDQGIIEGRAFETLRCRAHLCPPVQILADVHVKHAVPLGDVSLEASARDTLERGLADALIISGDGTGLPAEIDDVRRARDACPDARILVGSGVTAQNIHEFLPLADGFIVGTSLKVGGKVSNPVDPKRVAALAKAMEM